MRVRLRHAALLLALTAGVAGPVPPAAADGGRRERGLQTTGLPVPRFVTLRSGEVNVRTGPATTYPVEWVFVRKGMPVEITQEFDTWRRIRDWQGSEGWVHQSMLSGRRAIVVLGEVRDVHRAPDPAAPVVARVEPGVMGALQKCQGAWCEVDIQGYRGWLPRTHFWGVYPEESVE